MTGDRHLQAEFSHIMVVEQLGEEETSKDLQANPAERSALAKRFSLLALDSMRASLRIRRVRGGVVQVRGVFSADVVQACVVTLEPVPAHIEESILLLYAPEEGPAESAVVVPAEEAVPEPLVGGVIDLGEAVAQQLALALDTYPRVPGAGFEGQFGGADSGSREETATRRPFAALDVLRKKMAGD